MTRALDVELALARTVGALSRLRGGGATSLPGKVLMRLDPGAIGALGARLRAGSVLVSATNGKTTTAAMAASIFGDAGIALVHNRAGANMAGGVATELLFAARRGGRIDGELGLFEVDELWLDTLAAQLRPRAVLLGNLFRDQLDRYGELDAIAERWDRALHDGPARDAKAVLNADDPLVADLGGERTGVVFYGVEDDSLALSSMAHAADAKHCRRCGAPYAFEVVYLGHLGHYRCESCGQARPRPEVLATDISAAGRPCVQLHASHPGGKRADPAAPARALQRLQRARRRRAGDDAGRQPAEHRGGPAEHARRLRARRERDARRRQRTAQRRIPCART